MKMFKRLQDDKNSEYEDGLRNYPRFLNLLGNKLDIVKEGWKNRKQTVVL